MTHQHPQSTVSRRFTGRSGIVTGAGSGIGRAAALLLAERGARVLAVDIDRNAINDTARRAQGLPGSIIPHLADVTDPQQVADYAARADELFNDLWFFVSNAGVGGAHADAVDTDVEQWRRVMDININSNFYGLKYVIPALVRRGEGAVVVTGSLLSLKGAPRRADYTTSKHAVLGMTRAVAAEVASLGIKVNCICPGPIETPLQLRSEQLSNPVDPSAERRRFESGTPIGRYGTTREIAESIAFLLAPEVPYLTGAALTVDGGLQAV